MNVLVVCQHYWPEPFGVTDICEELVKRGHKVTIFTGKPNTGLPGNKIPREYKSSKVTYEMHNGVNIIRVPLCARKKGVANRIVNYLSFWRSANSHIKEIDKSFDVVLGYQLSPIMQVDAGLKYGKLHDTKMLLYCLDLWPASLSAWGIKERSLVYKIMKRVSKRIYRQADRIAVTSPLFTEYFIENLDTDIPDPIYLPQYAEDQFLIESNEIRSDYDTSKTNLTFAGNIGQAQSVITIVEAANLLRDSDDIIFHIVGSGSCLSQCEKRAEELGLHNIVFHGRHSLEMMPAFYSSSDAMLVTFEDSPMAQYTLPRKVTTYLAAGKPILAAANGETRRVIEGAACGLCCDTGDAEGLAKIALAFSSEPNTESMGIAAREYYAKYFEKEKFFSTLLFHLEELSKGQE